MSPRIGLSAFVNANLLQQLTQGTATSSGARAGSGTASPADLSSSLRIGAQTYSGAVRSLNTAASLINLSHETLEKLDSIVTDLIDLAKAATSPTMTEQTRRGINEQFARLVEDYQSLIDEASEAEIEFLSTGGLEAIFESAGLDPETSGGIAELFKEFVTAPEDSQKLLASEKSLAKEHPNIPATFLTEDYSEKPLERITGGPATTGFVTRKGSIFQAKDSYTLQNPGYQSVIIEDVTGTTNALPGLQGTGTFSSKTTVRSPNLDRVYSVASGDFNQDGRTDIIGGEQTGRVYVYTQAEDGSFSATDMVVPGSEINALVTDDFNNDGIQDFVSSNGDFTGSVYVGDGEGGFDLNDSFSLPTFTASLADMKSADLNGDGNADLITLDANSSSVDILLGDGSGTFGAADYSYSVAGPGTATRITLGDIDGDGQTDLVVGQTSRSVQLTGNGDGTFNAAVLSVNVAADDVVLADFDLDGDLDQATLDGTSNAQTVHVHSNDGSGNFTASVTSFAITSATLAGGRITTGQFDDTFGLDIAVSTASTVDYFSGDGALNFSSLSSVATNGSFRSLLAEDFNSDGITDTLSTGNSTVLSMIITDTTAPSYALSSDVSLLDVNKSDGYSLIAATENFVGQNPLKRLRLFLVDDTGAAVQQYSKSGLFTEFESASLAETNQRVAYIASDGIDQHVHIQSLLTPDTYGYAQADLAQRNVDTGTIGVTSFSNIELSDDGAYLAYFKESAGVSHISFREATGTLSEDAFLTSDTDLKDFGFVESDRLLVTRDTDLDGSGDEIVSYRHGDGAFGQTLASGLAISEFTTLEDSINRDQGYFAFHDSNTNSVQVYREGTVNALYSVQLGDNDSVSSLSLTYDEANNVELGIFGRLPSQADTADEELFRISVTESRSFDSAGLNTFSSVSSQAFPAYNEIQSVDLNNDGVLDLVSSDTAGGSIRTALGNGDGSFATSVSFATNGAASTGGFAIGDIDGDGNLDVVSTDGNTLNINIGNGDGTFAAGTSYGTSTTGVDQVELADFNNDGNLDFVAAAGDTFYLGRGRGDGTFISPMSYIVSGSPTLAALQTGDLNNDGNTDVYAQDSSSGTYVTYGGNGQGDLSQLNSANLAVDGEQASLADFNNDGILDLASITSTSDILVLQGQGDGSFSSAATLSIGNSAQSIATADMNQDGIMDIVVGGSKNLAPGGNIFRTFTGDAEFGFTSADVSASGVVQDVLVGDFDEDGAKDVLVSAGGLETFAQDTSGQTVQSESTLTNADNSSRHARYTTRTLVTSIFDSDRTLMNRADAFAILNDLKELQSQIRNNMKALDEGREVIQLNIDLARATGIGLIEISGDVVNGDTAESLAAKLRDQIRRNAPQALSQAENLSPMAALALLR